MEAPNPESPFWKALRITYKSARRIVIGVVGISIILVGIAMLVLPGPAFIVIPTGLAILGAEFAFAKRWLRVLRIQARNGLNTIGIGKRGARRAARRAARRPANDGAPGPPEAPEFSDPSAFDPDDQEGNEAAKAPRRAQSARNFRT